MPAGAIKITIHDDKYFLLSRLPSQWAKGKMPALPLLWKMPSFLICLAWLTSWAFRQIKKRNLTPGTLGCALHLLGCQSVSVLPVLLGKFSTQIPTACAREVPTSSGEGWRTGPRQKWSQDVVLTHLGGGNLNWVLMLNRECNRSPSYSFVSGMWEVSLGCRCELRPFWKNPNANDRIFFTSCICLLVYLLSICTTVKSKEHVLQGFEYGSWLWALSAKKKIYKQNKGK